MKTILKSQLRLPKISKKETFFLLNMMLCGFLLACEAAMTKSISTSFFVEAYDPSIFPYAWLCSLPLNLLVVIFYNQYIARLGPNRMMNVGLILTALFNSMCSFKIGENAILPFVLYVWKEVFVMFFFHSLWSVIHASVDMSRAKYLYGLFYGLGGLGSIAGGFLCHKLAQGLGSHQLLLLTVPLYVLTSFVYSIGVALQPGLKTSQEITFHKENASFSHGASLVKNSSVLISILVLVLCMQMSTTMGEFQFNLRVKEVYNSLDARTAFLGQILGVINSVNIFIQFFGSYILLRFFGLLSLHVLIPVVLFLNFIVLQFFPSFSLMCFNYGLLKSIDYSLFGIMTAMLYIPLSVEEKFQGKSFISILGYRGAKAVVSLLALIPIHSLLALVVFLFWMAFSYRFKKIFGFRYAT